jgi:hypothetical protein
VKPNVTPVTRYLDQHLPTCGRTHAEIAKDCDIRDPRLIERFRTGEWKIPMDCARAVALAIGADPRVLLRLVLDQHVPYLWETLEEVYPELRGDVGEGLRPTKLAAK